MLMLIPKLVKLVMKLVLLVTPVLPLLLVNVKPVLLIVNVNMVKLVTSILKVLVNVFSKELFVPEMTSFYLVLLSVIIVQMVLT
jgi:hypothetical protein